MEKEKNKFLDKEGLLNKKPDRISHSLFKTHEFFDPFDLLQVRYEMLRSVKVDGCSVAKACRTFGFSREYYYKLGRMFTERGFVGLLGAPSGRRPLIALNQELVNFIIHKKLEEPKLSGDNICKQIKKNYHVKCSTRTVERIIEKFGFGKKKGADTDFEPQHVSTSP